MVAIVDDEVAGVVGISRSQFVNVMFSDYRPALEPYLKSITVLRAVMQVMSWAAGRVVYAVPRDDEGQRVLKRLGFEPHGEVYRWPK